MAARCRARVVEAERAEYGAGFLGAVFMAMASAGSRRTPRVRSCAWARARRCSPRPRWRLMVLLTIIAFVVLLALIF